MALMTKIFSKKLTKTDISKRMSIPTNKLLVHFPGFESGHHAVKIKVEDEIGKLWIMRCSIRKQKYMKPVLSGDWIAFARSKNLGIGDKVTFYKVVGEVASGANYKVKVKKAKKLFGVIIGY